MAPLLTFQKKAFTLVELLVVISIIALTTSLTGPALQALGGAGSTNKAVSDIVGTLELARSYAMSNNTYVRVGFYQATASSSHAAPVTVVVSVFSANGSEATVMSSANWPALSKPVCLDNFVPNSKLTANSANAASDEDIFSSSSSFGSLDLRVSDLGPISFTCFVEFTPSGEARLSPGQSVRYIKIGVNRAVGNQSNAFILRLSGINGEIATLRKENIKENL